MLDSLLGRDVTLSGGTTVRIETRQASVRRGGLADVGDLARSLELGSRLLLLADDHTWDAAGAASESVLRSTGFATERLILSGHPVAGPPAVAHVREASHNVDAIVAIGSGTINDIAKSASTERGIPYLAVGTALSMNGYTSSISALLVDGVKRTLPARPPVGVVLDLDVCAAAPRTLTRAGLGDMLSKPFSEADWRLSHHLLGERWFPEPGELLGVAFDDMVRDAAAIGRGEPAALESLANAVLLSGLSMSVAGASSPASGGEHLLSHYWDMLCYSRGEEPHGLHGTQVGVACCLIEPLHHAVCSLTSIDLDIHIDRAVSAAPATLAIAEALVRKRHEAQLPRNVVDAIVVQALSKWVPPEQLRERLTRFAAHRQPILDHVRRALLPLGAVRGALIAAGGATTPEAIHEELAGDLSTWAIARDIRGRYTVLDLAAELGLGFTRSSEVS